MHIASIFAFAFILLMAVCLPIWIYRFDSKGERELEQARLHYEYWNYLNRCEDTRQTASSSEPTQQAAASQNGTEMVRDRLQTLRSPRSRPSGLAERHGL
jgi:hypothetical protein